MRRIRWAEAAFADLESINDYLQLHHPSFRQSTMKRLHGAAVSLKNYPNRGRIGQKEGTRELVMAPMPYVIVYAVELKTVHILRIFHSSRNWPSR